MVSVGVISSILGGQGCVGVLSLNRGGGGIVAGVLWIFIGGGGVEKSNFGIGICCGWMLLLGVGATLRALEYGGGGVENIIGLDGCGGVGAGL